MKHNINHEIVEQGKLVEEALDKYLKIDNEPKAFLKGIAELILERSKNGVVIADVEIHYNKIIDEETLGALVVNIFEYVQTVFSEYGYIEPASEYLPGNKTLISIKFDPFGEEDMGVGGCLPPNVIALNRLN